MLRRNMPRTEGFVTMNPAVLLIGSKNYSSWSLRGYLLARMSGIAFETRAVDVGDDESRAQLLMQPSSTRLPCLLHNGATIWDTLAIAEYLNEQCPDAMMFPADRVARARCRSISGEMHSSFAVLREALPMNLRVFRPHLRLWSAVRADIDRITEIWRECLGSWHGPWLLGDHPTVADAMFAPVVTRFRTYDIKMDAICEPYCQRVMSWAPLQDWFADAQQEAETIEELEVEF